MVPPSHAVSHRAHEEDRPLIASASRVDPQLFPGSETTLQRCRRGSEQQSQSYHEKILRVPHLPHSRTGPLSLTWQASRARVYPRVFLTILEFSLPDSIRASDRTFSPQLRLFLVKELFTFYVPTRMRHIHW